MLLLANPNPDATMDMLFIAAVFYFTPSIVASCRDHHRTTALFFVNLLFAWTAFGWLIVLAWAIVGKNKTDVANARMANKAVIFLAEQAYHDRINHHD